MNKKVDSNKKTAVIVGILFLVATATFMTGSILIQSYFDSVNPDKILLITGILLEILCGFAVVGIGILMFPILKIFSKIRDRRQYINYNKHKFFQ